MTKMISPLRYPGGKACLAPTLAAVLETNGMVRPSIAEPYAGGAGASLGLLLGEYAGSILINDLDYRVFALWWALLNHTEEFAERISSVPLSIAEWKRKREIYREPRRHRRFEVGFATFYLNRTNRSGILVNGGPIGGINQSGKWRLNARFNRSTLVNRVLRIAAYRERIRISNLDASVFIRRLRSDHAFRNTFVYLDPPYYEKGSDLYFSSYTHSDHLSVSKAIRSLPGHHWAVTYDDVPEIRKMYRGYRLTPFCLRYTANSSRKGRELLITSRELRIPNSRDWPMSSGNEPTNQ
jgi:DNA adenine methylase